MSQSSIVANIMKKYDGKTFMLFIKTVDGIAMDQLIPNATVRIDPEETYIVLNNSELMEVAQIPLHFEMDIEINELDSDDISEGSMESISIDYPSGNDLQIEIMEND